MDNFDDARGATLDMFAQQDTENAVEPQYDTVDAVGNDGSEAPPEGEQTESGNVRETPPEQIPNEVQQHDQPSAQDVQAQQLQIMQQEMASLRQQNDAIVQQNAQLQNMVNELSQQNKEHIAEEAVEMPVLDVSSLTFADEDAVRRAQTEYAQKMAAYTRNDVMKELQPFIDEARHGQALKEKQEAVTALKELPELQDIESLMPQLERIISGNKALSSDDMPIDEKLIMAYAIAKGVNAMNAPAPAEPTVQELMALYNNNSDFQNAVEQQRLAAVKSSQQVPPFSASSGAANAALNIKEKPKSFDEASERTRQLFGF